MEQELQWLDLLNVQVLADWFEKQNKIVDPPSVLIVEDDLFMKPAICKMIHAINPNSSIHWALTVQDAKRHLEIEKPRLVIADCLLGPGESGLVLWEECHLKYPNMPFLMMSGLSLESLRSLEYTKDSIRRSSMEIELPEVIQKPFYLKDVQTRLRQILTEG